jgi:hypothetical protein
MSWWRLTAQIVQKNGTTKTETHYVEADEAPSNGAVEVPRAPRPFEDWNGTTFVVDAVAKAKAEEEIRMRALSRAELKTETLRATIAMFIDELVTEGMITSQKRNAWKARLGL